MQEVADRSKWKLGIGWGTSGVRRENEGTEAVMLRPKVDFKLTLVSGMAVKLAKAAAMRLRDMLNGKILRFANKARFETKFGCGGGESNLCEGNAHAGKFKQYPAFA